MVPRARMKRTKPQVLPWLETRSQWAARAAACVRALNRECNVAALCREFPERLRECVRREGDRLPK